MSNTNVFDPASFSILENKFLLENVGKSWAVARVAIPEPTKQAFPHRREKNPLIYTVNPNAVRPLIEHVKGLIELEDANGDKWVGIEAVKDAIRIYLRESDKWAKDTRRGRPRFPSLNVYDAKGRPVRSATGADGAYVKTYFTADGKRAPFAIELVPDNTAEWHPEWSQADAPDVKSGIVQNDSLNRLECFCGFTTSYKPDSRSSFVAARARLSKHLRAATDDVEKHREAHTIEFGG